MFSSQRRGKSKNRDIRCARDDQGRTGHSRGLARAALVLAAWLGAGIGFAMAGAGIATPPIPGRGNLPPLGTRAPLLPPPDFGAVSPGDVHGFTTIGFVQSATVSSANCPTLPQSQWGGEAVVNDIKITIPCNTIVQFPAATFTWADFLTPSTFAAGLTPPAQLTLAASLGSAGFSYPSTEITVNGNIVAGEHIAGLVFISQQFLNTGTGYITGFDYKNGVLLVGNGPNGPDKARLQINDPKTVPLDPLAKSIVYTGRYSAGQSPDPRFSVDQDNPTIHAFTGYPMCVPRQDPGTKNDPLCPQQNRPLAPNCRNFAAAGVFLPTAREIGPPAAGQKYCSGFVMKAPFGTTATSSIPGGFIASSTEPDARQQAPLEIGDFIIWSGTLMRGDGQGPNGSDTISVNTINANVGIFTQPESLPVYLSLGNFSMSAESPLIFNGLPQEPVNRVVVEAFVTDVTSIVDVYLVDVDPNTGKASQRWITPASMTGGIGAFGSNGQIIDGGITTQFTGLVPGRVRLQAVKSVPGILASPTRTLRVVARSLCDPANINPPPPLPGVPPVKTVPCLKRAPAANGLFSGQYLAPEFNFIFPENAVPGDPIVPYDFWDFGFLVNGEGPGTGPLIPMPW